VGNKIGFEKLRRGQTFAWPVAWVAVALCSASFLQAAPKPELLTAAIEGNFARVRSLVQGGANPDQADVDGTTALHWVVRGDDLQTTGFLIQHGANVNAADRYGETAMHLATLNGDAGIVRLLLDAGVSPNAANPSGETALMTASRAGALETMKLLLDRGATVDASESVRKQTALMWAVAEDHPEGVKLLLQYKANINARSGIYTPPPIQPQRVGQAAGAGITRQKSPAVPQGLMSPLLYATRAGNLEMVKLLLSSGADVNQTDANNTSPLLLALVNGHLDVAAFLLEKGADPNITDGFGRAALFGAVDSRNAGYYANPLAGENKADSLELIEQLLKRGAKPNTQTTAVVPEPGWQQTDGSWVNFTGQTPFLRAALSGDVKVMRLLLSHGADPNIATREGTTPLMAAAGINYVFGRTYTNSSEESLQAVKLCLESGANVNAQNSLGLAAIHGAANRGSDDIVRLLAEKGAKLDLKDKEGRTPRTFAEGVFLAVTPPAAKPTTIALIDELLNDHKVALNKAN
jgi:uncharacterized protein